MGSEEQIAALPVIDDGLRIGLAKFRARACQFKRRRTPWLVNDAVRQVRELRHPAPDIEAIGIELFALQYWIEYAEVGGGIGAAAGDPLPVGGIAAGVGVDQRVPKPFFSLAPVDQEMLDQKRRHHHSDPIVHDAGVPEFAHPGVDDGIAGLTALPRLKRPVVALPWKGVERGLQVATCQIRHVKQQMTAEFTPAQFAQEFVDVAGKAMAPGRGEASGVPDLPWTDLAKAQMRREPRGA